MEFTALSKKFLRPALFVALAALACLGSWFRTLELYELQTYDWRCRLRIPRPISPDIVLVDIWDDSLEALGAWPFERTYHAELISTLKEAGVRAVAMDILFVEPRDGDETVEKAAKEAGNVYFVVALYNSSVKEGRFYAEKVLAPLIEPYERAAHAVAHVNSKADIDGKRRRTFPLIRQGTRDYYQLSIRVAMDILGVSDKDMKLVPGRSLEFGDKVSLPLDEEGFLLVNYAGTWEKTFRHVSYKDVIVSGLLRKDGRDSEAPLDLDSLKGKICFVGLTSLGSHDTNPIPIQTVYPLVGMHANVLNEILTRDFLSRAPRAVNFAVFLLLSGWVLFLAAKLKPLRAFGALLATLAVFIGVATAAFVYKGLWLDLFYPVTLALMMNAGATLYRILAEIRKRELIEGELKIASQIQKSFLPETVPREEGIEIAVFMRPAKAVGGDLYTFVRFDGDHRLGVMLGDVSGKGTPAALFMAKCVSEFKFSARGQLDPAEALVALNDSISAESTGGLFVTLTYAIFDYKEKKLRLSNAGHLPLVTSREDGPGLITSDEGMPIGVMAGIPFSVSDFPIALGDCFALYSDGVSEARDKKAAEFGVEALQKAIHDRRGMPVDEILKGAVLDLTQFMGKADQHDDITLIIVKVVAPTPIPEDKP